MKWIVNLVATLATWLRGTPDASMQALMTHSNGVVIGRHEDGRPLVDWTDDHVLVIAPTRSGKGVGVMTPTLLSWPESVVVIDIKGERYCTTSQYRSTQGDVACFNPMSNATLCWNPLLEIRPNAIEDVLHVVDILLPLPSEIEARFDVSGARDILVASIVHSLSTKQNHDLGSIRSNLCHRERWFDVYGVLPVDEDAAYQVQNVIDRVCAQSESVQKKWFDIALCALALWRCPLVSHATSKSDFRLEDLQNKALSLYLVIPPQDMHRLSVLVRLFLSQMTRVLTHEVQDRRVLVIGDELPAFGPMPHVAEALPYMASYRIKWLVHCHSIEQMHSMYGQACIDCFETKVVYTCHEMETARMLANASISQLMRLEQGQLIIMQEGQDPIKAHNVTYFDDPRFMDKVCKVELPTLDNAPTESVPTDVLLSIISKDQKGE